MSLALTPDVSILLSYIVPIFLTVVGISSPVSVPHFDAAHAMVLSAPAAHLGDDWVMEKEAGGAGAAGLFVSELRAAIEDGFVIVDATMSGGDRWDLLELDLAGAETMRLEVTTDAAGFVIATRVLRGNAGPESQCYDATAELAEELDQVSGGPMKLQFVGDSVFASDLDGEAFTLHLDRFAAGDEESC
jgi:hypothetical protein